jgi:hypothetical protein
VTDELFDLSTMAMEYFKEHIEPNLPDLAFFNKNFINFTGEFLVGLNGNCSTLTDPLLSP